MNYDLIYSAAGEADLARRLPAGLIDLIEERMLDLAERPASLSRRSAFPYPTGFQIYQFFLAAPFDNRHITVFFRYSQSETELHIAMIGHVECSPAGRVG